MNYSIIITHSAKKTIKNLDENTRTRIIKRMKEMQKCPFTGDVKPLKGLPGEWRTRVGDWRIIYSVDRDQLIVMVLKVAHRGGAYKSRR